MLETNYGHFFTKFTDWVDPHQSSPASCSASSHNAASPDCSLCASTRFPHSRERSKWTNGGFPHPNPEALLQLEKEGLVEIYPQSGTRISKISMEEVRESHFIREAMESATVRFAAQQGDSKLHKQLKSRLQQFKDSLDTAEKDLLFELDELFH